MESKKVSDSKIMLLLNQKKIMEYIKSLEVCAIRFEENVKSIVENPNKYCGSLEKRKLVMETTKRVEVRIDAVREVTDFVYFLDFVVIDVKSEYYGVSDAHTIFYDLLNNRIITRDGSPKGEFHALYKEYGEIISKENA